MCSFQPQMRVGDMVTDDFLVLYVKLHDMRYTWVHPCSRVWIPVSLLLDCLGCQLILCWIPGSWTLAELLQHFTIKYNFYRFIIDGLFFSFLIFLIFFITFIFKIKIYLKYITFLLPFLSSHILPFLKFMTSFSFNVFLHTYIFFPSI